MAKETTLDGVTVTSGVTGMASALDDLIKIFGAGDDAASLREVMAMSKEIDQEQDRQIQHGDDDLGRVEEMLQQKLRMKQDDLESDISNEIIEISERRAEVSRLSDSLLEQIDSVDGELKQKKLLIRELDSKRNEIEQKHNSKMMQLSRNHTLLSKLGIQWEANCDQMDEFIHEYKGCKAIVKSCVSFSQTIDVDFFDSSRGTKESWPRSSLQV